MSLIPGKQDGTETSGNAYSPSGYWRAIGGDAFEYTLACIVMHPRWIARGGRTWFRLSAIRGEKKKRFTPARFNRSTLYGGLLLITFLVCGHAAFGQDFATNTYTVSTEDFANPDRGFYIQADSYASAPSTVPANLASYRINGKSSPG